MTTRTRLPFLLCILLCLAGSFFPGCAIGGKSGSDRFPKPAADWQTYTGQMHFRSTKGRSIIGDVVIRRSAHGDFQLEFQSGPGVPLMRYWKSGASERVEGILARGSWNWPAGRAPKPLRDWAALPAVFEAAEHSHPPSVAAAGASGTASYAGKRIVHLEVNGAGGNHFAFHFSR